MRKGNQRTAVQYLCLLVATTTITVLSGCTQEQQRSISSSGWDKDIADGLSNVIAGTKKLAQRTGDWIATESKIIQLRFKVDRTVRDKTVTASQAANLKNSLAYIENLQSKSIDSDDGVSPSERTTILAAVDRVEKRLDGWIAANKPAADTY